MAVQLKCLGAAYPMRCASRGHMSHQPHQWGLIDCMDIHPLPIAAHATTQCAPHTCVAVPLPLHRIVPASPRVPHTVLGHGVPVPAVGTKHKSWRREAAGAIEGAAAGQLNLSWAACSLQTARWTALIKTKIKKYHQKGGKCHVQ